MIIKQALLVADIVKYLINGKGLEVLPDLFLDLSHTCPHVGVHLLTLRRCLARHWTLERNVPVFLRHLEHHFQPIILLSQLPDQLVYLAFIYHRSVPDLFGLVCVS